MDSHIVKKLATYMGKMIDLLKEMFNMAEFLNKLKSRKFLTCVAGVVMGACMVFGLDVGTVNTIAGAIVAASSVVAYICTEGKIDASAVDKIKDVVDKIEDATDSIKEIEE